MLYKVINPETGVIETYEVTQENAGAVFHKLSAAQKAKRYKKRNDTIARKRASLVSEIDKRAKINAWPKRGETDESAAVYVPPQNPLHVPGAQMPWARGGKGHKGRPD